MLYFYTVKAAAVFVLLAMSGFGVLAQDVRPKGSISGRVVDTDTHAPVADVRVGSDETGYSMTDSDGRYILRNAPSGQWRIMIMEGNSTDLFLAALQNAIVTPGRDTSGIDFQVRLTAQISGRVLDEAGKPVQGVRISAVLTEYLSSPSGYGNRTISAEVINHELYSGNPAEIVLTDYRGYYVITNVLAGRKYWILAHSPGFYSKPISDSPSDPQARKKSLVATYYPGSSTMDGAVPVVLHSFERRDDVDIRIASVPSYCLDATLTAGGTPAKMRFVLAEDEVYRSLGVALFNQVSSESGNDGRIRLCDLYSGRFQLAATRRDASGGLEYTATVPVTITDQDVRDLVVTTLPRSSVSGDITWEGGPPGDSDIVRPITVRTFPDSAPPAPGVQPAVTILVPDQFSLQVHSGHHYVLEVAGLSSPFYVKDITYGGTRILHKPFVPGDGDEKLRITIGRDAGSVTAHVTRNDGGPAVAATVLFMPANAQSEGELAATTIAGLTDDNGAYTAAGLPPGKYFALALTDPPPSVVYHGNTLWLDLVPETFVKLLGARSRGQLVEVSAGATSQIELAPTTLE